MGIYKRGPARAGKIWTEEEKRQLREIWGKTPTKTIARMMGRSVRSIQCMVGDKLRLGSRLAQIDGITVRQISFLLVNPLTSDYIGYLAKRGLKMYHLRGQKTVYTTLPDFWRWAKDNVAILNLEKLKDGELGKPPEWVREAWESRANKPKYKAWTPEEIAALEREAQMGVYTEAQIARMHGRSVKAINRMLLKSGCPYRCAEHARRKYFTAADCEEMLRMHRAGWHIDAIAEKVGHSTGSVEIKICKLMREERV